MLFEEVFEMGDFCKTQCVGDFGHVPFAVLQQDFGLLQDTIGNDLRGRFLNRFL